MSQKKEEFLIAKSGEVKLYVLWPDGLRFFTCWKFSRADIFLIWCAIGWKVSGYKVTFVYNYTDVDDRIIQRAHRKRNVDAAVDFGEIHHRV